MSDTIPDVPEARAEGTPRPEPVLDAGKTAGLVSAVVVAAGGCAVLAGVATAEDVQLWATAIGAVVVAGISLAAYLVPVWQARKARRVVTPLEDPRAFDGTPLRRVGADYQARHAQP